MKLKVLSLTVVLVAMAAIFSACGSTANNAVNTNANTRVTNLNANSNVAVLVNNNSALANSNRWNNANITKEDYEKNKADYDKDRGSSKIGTGANDGWLWTKTRASLLTTNDLRESTIDVDVDNAVVTLRGTVANAAQKAKAEQVAKGIEDVKSVKNELKIAANDSMTNTGGSSSNSGNHNANTKK
jgi:hyperosmotically inducible periplasmic protein